MSELTEYYGVQIPIEYYSQIEKLDTQIQISQLKEIYLNGEVIVDHIPMKYQQYRERIVGIVYYYYAYSALKEDDQDAAWNYIIKALGYVQGEGSTQMLAKIFLLLGDIALFNGDQTSAIESYLSVLELCEGESWVEERVRAYFQYGRIMMDYSHFEQAIEVYEKGVQDCTNDIIQKLSAPIYLRTIGGLILCYWKIKKDDLAEKYLKQLEQDQELWIKDHEMDTDIKCLKLVCLLKHGKQDEVSNLENEIMESLPGWKPERAMKTAMILIFKFLLLQKREQFINLFFDWIYAQDDSEAIERVKDWIAEIRLAYCLESGNCTELYAAGKELLSQGERHKMNRRHSFHRLFSMREEIRRIEKMQIELSLMNENLLSDTLHDAMTGLPNRVYFADYAAQMVERLRNTNTSMVVGIIDIDYFKCVNDTYGHVVGDESVIRIGKAIEEWAGSKLFCARYGGDEFVVIGENLSVAEIEEMASQLKNQMRTMEIRNSSSPIAPYITLSQGYFIHSVELELNIWNFLNAADNLMYKIKKTTKNDFHISTTWCNDRSRVNDTTNH